MWAAASSVVEKDVLQVRRRKGTVWTRAPQTLHHRKGNIVYM